MPSFARELEQTLHTALAEASGRRHEYATLESEIARVRAKIDASVSHMSAAEALFKK